MIVTSKQGEYLSSGFKEKQRTRVHQFIHKAQRYERGGDSGTQTHAMKQKPNLRGIDIEDIGIRS